MFRWIYGGIAAVIIAMAAPTLAFSHVIVSPDTVATGAWQTFSISVPNEKDNPTIKVVLHIPDSITHVTPTMQPGFTITTDGKDNSITSVTWSGEVPVGQRVELSFSAQAPATTQNLDWKADQYYADGSIVHWDQNPNSAKSDTPYSITKVVAQTSDQPQTTSSLDTLAISLSITAIVLSIGSIFIVRQRARK